MQQIPEPDTLSLSWLRAALADEPWSRRAELTGFHAEPTPIQGLAGRIFRVFLEFSGDGEGPRSLIAKFHSGDPDSRALHTLRRMYATEVAFYRRLSGSVGTRVPHCYHASGSRGGDACVLLLEDFPDSCVADDAAGLSLPQALAMADSAARLHARWWNWRDSLARETWLASWTEMMELDLAAARLQSGRSGEALPARTFERELGTSSLRRLESAPVTLLHGDLSGKNLLFDDGDEPVLIDWQLACTGPAAFDVAHLVAISLNPSGQAGFTTAVLAAYHACLVASGVHGYTHAALAADYLAALEVQLAHSRLVREHLAPGSGVEQFVGWRADRFASALESARAV